MCSRGTTWQRTIHTTCTGTVWLGTGGAGEKWSWVKTLAFSDCKLHGGLQQSVCRYSDAFLLCMWPAPELKRATDQCHTYYLVTAVVYFEHAEASHVMCMRLAGKITVCSAVHKAWLTSCVPTRQYPSSMQSFSSGRLQSQDQMG
jgi:hypothetical protein